MSKSICPWCGKDSPFTSSFNLQFGAHYTGLCGSKYSINQTGFEGEQSYACKEIVALQGIIRGLDEIATVILEYAPPSTWPRNDTGMTRAAKALIELRERANLTTSPKAIISGEVSSTDAVSALPRHRGDGREDGCL